MAFKAHGTASRANVTSTFYTSTTLNDNFSQLFYLNFVKKIPNNIFRLVKLRLIN